jgi:hypothetical protein
VQRVTKAGLHRTAAASICKFRPAALDHGPCASQSTVARETGLGSLQAVACSIARRRRPAPHGPRLRYHCRSRRRARPATFEGARTVTFDGPETRSPAPAMRGRSPGAASDNAMRFVPMRLPSSATWRWTMLECLHDESPRANLPVKAKTGSRARGHIAQGIVKQACTENPGSSADARLSHARSALEVANSSSRTIPRLLCIVPDLLQYF